MLERKVILIQLSVFAGLLLAIFETNALAAKGVLREETPSTLIPFEMLGAAVVAWTLIGRYQRSKIFRPLIEGQFKEGGYTLVSERPLNLKEIMSNLELSFSSSISIDNVSIKKFVYRATNARILHVASSNGEELLLRVIITQPRKGEVEVKIIETTVLKSIHSPL